MRPVNTPSTGKLTLLTSMRVQRGPCVLSLLARRIAAPMSLKASQKTRFLIRYHRGVPVRRYIQPSRSVCPFAIASAARLERTPPTGFAEACSKQTQSHTLWVSFGRSSAR